MIFGAPAGVNIKFCQKCNKDLVPTTMETIIIKRKIIDKAKLVINSASFLIVYMQTELTCFALIYPKH